MSENEPSKFCTECGTPLPGNAKFCPSCGVKTGSSASVAGQSTPRGVTITLPRMKELVVAAAITIPVLGLGWWTQGWLAGSKPTVTYESMLAERDAQDDSQSDPTLVRLRDATKAFPDDVTAWKTLAEALLVKLQSGDESRPPPRLVLETIDVLREVLNREPNDQFALRSMADISLNQQVFAKAVEYFERYLKIVPTDRVARARYASALSFTGKGDEALRQLNSILKEDPENFYASAYLAVTYAQMGDKEKALKSGQTALTHAPNEEARARFSSFLDSLNEENAEPPVQGSPPRGNVTAPQAPAAGTALQDYLKGHQIAGSRFVSVHSHGGVVRLTFNDFPMEKMPPAIRDKFVTAVKEKAALDYAKITKIVFVDATSGAELHSATMP